MHTRLYIDACITKQSTCTQWREKGLFSKCGDTFAKSQKPWKAVSSKDYDLEHAFQSHKP